MNEAVNVVFVLCILMVVGTIGVFIADKTVTTTALTTTSTNATGTLTFTDAAACGDWFNITTAAGTTVSLYFNVTNLPTACQAIPWYAAGVVIVNSTGNSSSQAPKNISAAINTNATLSAVVTATNNTETSVLLTYYTTGTGGNSVTTTETSANASWGAAALTGGATKSDVAGMQTNILSAGETGSSFIVILIIAFIGGIAISYMFNLMGKKRK